MSANRTKRQPLPGWAARDAFQQQSNLTRLIAAAKRAQGDKPHD